MPFETILKNLLESAIYAFNTGDYKKLDSFLIKNAELVVPEVKNGKIHTPATHLFGCKNIYSYWNDVNSNYNSKITNVEFIEIGKVSHIRCEYGNINLTMEMLLYFNEYGKATKLVHLSPK